MMLAIEEARTIWPHRAATYIGQFLRCDDIFHNRIIMHFMAILQHRLHAVWLSRHGDSSQMLPPCVEEAAKDTQDSPKVPSLRASLICVSSLCLILQQ